MGRGGEGDDGTSPAPAATASTGYRHPWTYRLLALALAGLATLVVLEIGFRIAGYEPLHAVYSTPEIFWKADPLLGWSLEPGASGTYVGPRPFPIAFRADVRINEWGLRGPEVLPQAPEGGRVLVLGDSQVAAFEVDHEQTYAARTAQRLSAAAGRPVEVVNGGVRGYGTDQTYLLYTERLHRLRPDVVVFHASANDPEDDTTLHRMRRPFGKPAFALADDSSLELVGVPVPDYPFCSLYRLDDSSTVRRLDGLRSRILCGVQYRLADHSAMLSFVAVQLQRNPRLIWQLNRLGTAEDQETHVPPAGRESPAGTDPPSGKDPPGSAPAAPSHAAPPGPPSVDAPLDHAHRLTSALIRALAAEVRGDGAQFVLLINAADLATLDGAAFEREGIPIVLADDALGADQTDYRIPNDGHLNPEGHQRLAALLTDRLELP